MKQIIGWPQPNKPTNAPLNRWIWLFTMKHKMEFEFRSLKRLKKHHGKGIKILVNLGYLTNPQSSNTRQDNPKAHKATRAMKHTRTHQNLWDTGSGFVWGKETHVSCRRTWERIAKLYKDISGVSTNCDKTPDPRCLIEGRSDWGM